MSCRCPGLDRTIRLLATTGEGLYECQVSSFVPKLSHLIELRMVEAESRISNLSSLFVRLNDLVNITCTMESPHKTDFVYWYKNKEPIYYDNLRTTARTKRTMKVYDDESDKIKNLIIAVGPSPSSSSVMPSDSAGAEAYGDHADNNSRQARSHRQLTHSDNKGLHDNIIDGDDADGDDADDPSAASSSSLPSKMFRAPTTTIHTKGSHQQIESSSSSVSIAMTQMIATTTAAATTKKNKPKDNFVGSSSSLIIKQAQRNDTANYTCVVSTDRECTGSVKIYLRTDLAARFNVDIRLHLPQPPRRRQRRRRQQYT